MECGVPFCHGGCPLGNLIPDWNDLVYRDRWREAIDQLHRTNNFPEFTGRLCPAPCEAACVLEIREGDAVTIKQIEVAIVDRAWEEGWIVPQPPRDADRPRASPSSAPGPPGSPARSSSTAPGHRGGRLRARRGGRRARPLRRAGLQAREAFRRPPRRAARGRGRRVPLRRRRRRRRLRRRAARGATTPSCSRSARACPRDLPVPGRELDGVHFAMDYLYQRNRWVARELGPQSPARRRRARADQRGRQARRRDRRRRHRRDCVGNAHREGAASVTQIELVGEPPPSRRDDLTPWPSLADEAPDLVRARGGRRARFSISTTALRRRRRGRADPVGARTAVSPVRPDPGDARRSARPSSSSSRWASSGPEPGVLRRRRRPPTTAATSVRRHTRRAVTAFLPPATRGAGSR